MWWLDPGKEVLNVVCTSCEYRSLFNRILAPYVENLDMNQLGYGIAQGLVSLGKLRLKKGALDKFRLPVDVIEGHLGKFTLSLHWMNLGNQPVEVLVEDVYLLVVPSEVDIDPEEEEARTQAAKADRLENAELLHTDQVEQAADSSQQQRGLWSSILTKIVNNLQVTVKNIHIRYEDKISVPGHPFAGGITLAGFKAVSTNENWEAAFIESTAGAIHKLANLDSLAVYFDTDSPTIAGLSPIESVETFHSMHQFVLRPVSGEGRIVMNHHVTSDTPRFDVQLLFDEIGVVLDDDQYRDAISLVDMYQVYIRQRQYRKFRPSPEEFSANAAQAHLKFALRAITAQVRERKRQWTWAYLRERRNDRKAYVDLFQRKLLNGSLAGVDLEKCKALEWKLSYEDLRFYRSIARSRLRKDASVRKRLEAERARKQQPQGQTWSGWLWGASTQTDPADEEPAFTGQMTEEQRKELYAAIDYDERAAVAEALQASRTSLKMRIAATLKKGSLALKTDPHGSNENIIYLLSTGMRADVLQRQDNLEASVALGGISVFDHTAKDTLYPEIVQVKNGVQGSTDNADDADPFFYAKYESNPLDERADSAITMRMRHMEIIYHKGYVEAIYRFFKPPASQLESVEALLNVASQTLEGIRRDTRAGLEYALQNHKTIDIQMDMNAPIIIIPEDIASEHGTHLIVDAGHIAIHSELANEEAKREIASKRNQQYTEEDYKRLEMLMYDKIHLQLQAAQFVIGSDLRSCRDALASEYDTLHLLERINVDLQIENSIAPTAYNLPRIKVAGKLPTLQVNMSDSKYKALMRLIDVCIPKFGDESTPVPLDIHQVSFSFNFAVDTLCASLFKSSLDGSEKSLGDVSFDHFGLAFSMQKYDMKVDVRLRSLTMSLVNPGRAPIKFMSSNSELPEAQDLLTVHYVRVDKISPEFFDVFHGIDQSVDVRISTFIFRAAPEPVVSLYDFIMTTFVPQNGNQVTQAPRDTLDVGITTQKQSDSRGGVIKVQMALQSVQVVLVNDHSDLATLSMTTADVVVDVTKSLRVSGRLGSLELSNDVRTSPARNSFDQLLSIEGENFAEFLYETYDPNAENYDGVKSFVSLQAASVKLQFLEGPLHDIYVFLMKLARLKGLYDAATQAAVQTASEIERMQFDVSVKSPIVILPSDPALSDDHLVLRLGEITAKNKSEAFKNRITAGLSGITLVSNLHYDGQLSSLKIIDDINVNTVVVQTTGIDRSQDLDYPDNEITVEISDVRLHLTQSQYSLFMDLAQSIPRVLQVPTTEDTSTNISMTPVDKQTPVATGTAIVSLEPELKVTEANGSRCWATIDLAVSVNAIKLHLYDGLATDTSNLKDHGIAKFALSQNTLRYKSLSDSSGEAQVVVKSFTVSNTRAGNSRYREIIPAAQHDRNQFMLLYTMSAGLQPSSVAILSIDAPQIIFAIAPVFGMLEFFTSPFSANAMTAGVTRSDGQQQVEEAKESLSTDFRLDLHDVSIIVLENDADADSQAIRLTINEILLSQQSIMALTVSRLGMSLLHMSRPSESVRFMDDFDITLSLHSQSSSLRQTMSFEVSGSPIVFRASNRDINLIMTIVNKAIQLYGEYQRPSDDSASNVAVNSKRTPVGRAKVSLSTEKASHFKGFFEGIRLILIGDMHEQPMLHLKIRPFQVEAQDWTAELKARTTLGLQITYWNLTNSHWEPLIDPWTFTASVARDDPSRGECLRLGLSSQDRFDLNISTTFVELALTTLTVWNEEEAAVLSKSRGSYAPYRIRNRTGSTIFVWSDNDHGIPHSASKDISIATKDVTAVKIQNDETIDWRFDDWKATREHVALSMMHNIGIQFVGKPWENMRGIPVDREGEFIFSLRPRIDKYPSRLLCEVKVVDTVKVVTIRSTYRVQNQSLYPLELTLVDEAGHPVSSLEKINPGGDYALPIDAVTKNRIRIQPDQGFGYKWCSAIRWEDLVAKRTHTVKCVHTNPHEPAFRFQAWVQTDIQDLSSVRKYPKIDLRLRAPLELENLLPFNIQYRIYDKNTDQNWRSYLRKGGVTPVHSVELGHLFLLNVDVQDTAFKPSDFAIINTDRHSDFEIENRLVLRDGQDRKLNLRLNYVRYPDSGGAFKVQIYSPYLVINKTGLPFGVRCLRRASSPQDVAGETRPVLSHPQENLYEFIFKVGVSGWSKALNIKAPSAESVLITPSLKNRNEEIHIGISWSEGSGRYQLTKVITLAPRFIIKNNLSDTISFREHGVAPKDRATLDAGGWCPLHFLRSGQDKLLTVAISGLNAAWSAPINIEDIGSVYVRLMTPGDAQVSPIRVDVQMSGPTIFVSFNSAGDEWPFVISNSSDYSFSLSQIDVASGERGVGRTAVQYVVQPHSSLLYAWDYPAARDKRMLLTINNYRRAVDPMEIGDLMPFKFKDGQRNRAVSLDVRAEGPQQILRITNYDARYSAYKPRLDRGSSLSIHRSDTLSTISSTEAFEAITEEVPPTMTFSIDFAGIGMSFVNRKLIEVIYVSMNVLKFEYSDSPVAQTVNMSCGTLQIDNQLHDALYPVILQPTPIPKEAGGVAALPTVQTSVIWLKDQEHGVFFVKYCSVLLQALTIEADEDLLFSLYDLAQIKGASWDEGPEDVLIPPGDIPEPSGTTEGLSLYFEVLEFQPIKLLLSFMRTERVSSDEKLSMRNPLAVVLNALTMTLGNVNDAPLELNALAIKDMRLTLPELTNRVTYHYRQDVLRQIYRILGSADFIGNPVGLFTNVSSGVADIFYEPFNGVVMHGQGEFGVGIAKGAASFVKKTVFGLSDSVTKFTSSVGKGLSAATFDSEYQARRRLNQRRNKPRHAIYGVAAGGEALANSVASAMEGVVMKPIEGAESEGALGFFKGVGKGIVGVVTKPVVGVFDLAANVSEGIRNTTTVFDSPARDRVRLPRHVPADGVLRPYSPREALGQYWMRDLENGAYREEAYVAHIDSPGGDNVVLLTSARVLSFWSKRLRLEWELPFTQVAGVTVEDNGIRFAHKTGRENDKFVYIPDKKSQSWFFQEVASVVKAFNARRRMDV
ncbi:hypothetical protein FISHEDRAFT_63685 [Fistulina hepatica ATCC 64428]|uniref:Vacuolar protein sorting-associated protein 13 n=1 Tax=Fistulina hepatica ATCC 64428 TaxID=1128425 RepID=A0A0D7ALW2_9AGAR|nr:hypothetical protein FISHEDRAFT_63685 [Fistulina hepatica ATCC 64428]